METAASHSYSSVGFDIGPGIQAARQVWGEAQTAVRRVDTVLVAVSHVQSLALCPAGVHRQWPGLLHSSNCRCCSSTEVLSQSLLRSSLENKHYEGFPSCEIFMPSEWL